MPKTKMSRMQRFIEEYLYVEFESHSYTTDQFKSFARKFKSGLKQEMAPEFEIAKFTVGHFGCSCFLRHIETKKYVYVSISEVRGFNNEWYREILIRNAVSANDYHGGSNNYCPLVELKENVMKLV